MKDLSVSWKARASGNTRQVLVKRRRLSGLWVSQSQRCCQLILKHDEESRIIHWKFAEWPLGFCVPTLKNSSTSCLPNHLTSRLLIDGKSNQFPDFLKLQFRGKNPKGESFKPWRISVEEQFFASKEMKAIGSEERACKKTLYLSFHSERTIALFCQCAFAAIFESEHGWIFSSNPRAHGGFRVLIWTSGWSLYIDCRLKKSSPSNHLHPMECL